MDEQNAHQSPQPGVIQPIDSQREALTVSLRKVAVGDRDAFEEVYRRTSAKLFSVCVRILGEKSEAEEALQNVFAEVWLRAGSFDESRGSAMTWLITLSRNRSVDRLRSRSNIATASIDLSDIAPDDRPNSFDQISAKQESRRIEYCLDALNAGDARLIRAAFFEGSTYPELAIRTGVPHGTMKSRIRRALFKLRECLQ